MEDIDHIGSEVLEALAIRDQIDNFYEAVDSDNLAAVKKILLSCQICPIKIQHILHALEDD